jgi:hypothetical protein
MWHWALLLFLVSGKRRGSGPSSQPVRATGQPGPTSTLLVTESWLHPLPPLVVNGATYAPVISDHYQAVATPGPNPPKHRKHLGVDIGYKRKNGEPTEYKPPRDGTKLFFFPPGIPVRAARSGRVWHVGQTAKGWSVTVISDSGRTKVWYQHLESVAVAQGQDVRRGDVLGVQGFSPDGDAYRHLHLETSRWNASRKAWDRVDPALLLRVAQAQVALPL